MTDKEELIDHIEQLIADTHDIDVTDRDYAVKVADWVAAKLAKDAKAHEKELAVWAENYAAIERKLAEVEAERDHLEGAQILNRNAILRLQVRAEAADANLTAARAALVTARNEALDEAINRLRIMGDMGGVEVIRALATQTQEKTDG